MPLHAAKRVREGDRGIREPGDRPEDTESTHSTAGRREELPMMKRKTFRWLRSQRFSCQRRAIAYEIFHAIRAREVFRFWIAFQRTVPASAGTHAARNLVSALRQMLFFLLRPALMDPCVRRDDLPGVRARPRFRNIWINSAGCVSAFLEGKGKGLIVPSPCHLLRVSPFIQSSTPHANQCLVHFME